MKFTHDSRYHIAYICFQAPPTQVEAIRVSDELIVDLAPDGTIYGIDLLNANEPLQRDNQGGLHK
jgi:uncharacterized protein YuzE